MQELRFVSVEDGWLTVSAESGERYRIRVDEALRSAVKGRPEPRSSSPKVSPRQIQQLIRAGHSVQDVVTETGADPETVARFEAPILAERGYIVEQARAVPVRLHHADPLANDASTFGAAIDDRLEHMDAEQVTWDAWRDPDTGWHIGLDFITGDVERHALWKFDPKAHSLRPDSPAAVTLSQQGAPEGLQGPYLRAVHPEPSEGVIPLAKEPELSVESEPHGGSSSLNETADLLEQLRKRRGERQHAVYDEMAEYQDDDEFVIEPDPHPSFREATVTQFGAPRTAAADDAAAEFAPDSESGPGDAPTSAPASTPEPTPEPEVDPAHDPIVSGDEENQLDLDVEQSDAPPQSRRRSGRPAMPTWDEIVFGTRTDE